MTPTPTVPVLITWLPYEEGGRQHPISNRLYAATTHMSGIAEGEGWSIVIVDAVHTADYRSKARLAFLVEAAPHHLLQVGVEVPIMEGPRIVGYATVVNTDEDA